jgi:TRAP-type mannitol/chloroaromatic compound transport system permease small subunit
VTLPTDSATAAFYQLSVHVFCVIPTVSNLVAIFVRYRMAKIHFRSLEASQNKSDVTNRFVDRDFMVAVCTCFLRKCGRFEVIRDFRSLRHGGIGFPVDGRIAEQS